MKPRRDRFEHASAVAQNYVDSAKAALDAAKEARDAVCEARNDYLDTINAKELTELAEDEKEFARYEAEEVSSEFVSDNAIARAISALKSARDISQKAAKLATKSIDSVKAI